MPARSRLAPRVVALVGAVTAAAALAASLPAAAVADTTFDPPGTRLLTEANSARDIATGPDGTTAVTWIDGGGLQARIRPGGGSWGPQELITATPEFHVLGAPKVAVDGNGRVLVAWLARENAPEVRIAERTASGAWSITAPYSAADDGDNSFNFSGNEPIDLAVNPRGDAVVAWNSTATNAPDHRGFTHMTPVRVGRRPAGGDWQPSQLFSSLDPEHDVAQSPKVVIDNAGGVTAIWHTASFLPFEDRICASHTINARTRTSRGTLTAIQLLTPNDGCFVFTHGLNIDLALAGSSTRIATFDYERWCACAEDHITTWYVAEAGTNGQFSRTTIWRPDAQLVAVTRMSAAANAAGEAVIAGMTHGDSNRIRVATRSAGGGWSGAQVLDGTSQSSMATTSIDRYGNAFAAWRRYVEGPYIVEASERAAGAGWSKPETLADFVSDTPLLLSAGGPFAETNLIWGTSDGLNALVSDRAPMVFKDGNVLRYVAGSGVRNRLTVRLAGGTVRFVDATGDVAPGPGCSRRSSTEVLCSPTDVARVEVDTADGDDRVTNLLETLPVIVRGGDDDDTLVGGPAVDRLYGEGGDDTLDGKGAGDTHDGGAGVDTVSYATRTAPVVVQLDGAANDGERGEGDRDRSLEVVHGGSAGDTLIGGDADETLQGRAGNDRLQGGLGADVLDGGADSDTITYTDRTESVAVRLDNRANDGADPDRSGASSAAEEGDRDRSIEHATGGDGDDSLFATAAALVVNVLRGGDGADRLVVRDAGATEGAAADEARCGGGDDVAVRDAHDLASADCEQR